MEYSNSNTTNQNATSSSDSTVSMCNIEKDLSRNIPLISMSGFFIVVGIFSNFLVIASYFCKFKDSEPKYYIIVSLAHADFAISMISLPLHSSYYICGVFGVFQLSN